MALYDFMTGLDRTDGINNLTRLTKRREGWGWRTWRSPQDGDWIFFFVGLFFCFSTLWRSHSVWRAIFNKTKNKCKIKYFVQYVETSFFVLFIIFIFSPLRTFDSSAIALLLPAAVEWLWERNTTTKNGGDRGIEEQEGKAWRRFRAEASELYEMTTVHYWSHHSCVRFLAGLFGQVSLLWYWIVLR